MQLSTQLTNASVVGADIVRTLRDGPNYQPHWRSLVMEQYLLEVAKAEDKTARLDQLLLAEKDPYLRQLVCYQFNRRCVLRDPIRYALRCSASNNENRVGSLIKAMTVAGRSPKQIAVELGTEAINIITYLKIFFDVGRYLNNRAWLKRICFPIYREPPTAVEETEARWLGAAYLRGWAGLAQIVCNRPPEARRTTKLELDQVIQVLVARSNDYVAGLESVGVLPSELDIRLLALVGHRMEQLGLPLKPEDLIYPEPLDPEKQKRTDEAKELVKGLSLLARKKIARILERVQSDSWPGDTDLARGNNDANLGTSGV